jgi:hypothetical protein
MLLTGFLFLLHLLFLTAAATPTPSPLKSLITRDDGDVEITAQTDSNGNFKLVFSQNGAVQGYLVETTPSDTYPYYFIALDASGAPVDAASLLSGAASGVLELEIELANLTQQFGKAAWEFFKSIGWGAVKACFSFFWGCAAGGTLPWLCVPGLACVAVYGAEALEAC